MLNLLEECPHWMADGTFKVSPALFTQMYTVHVILGEDVFPRIYAFLSSKNRQTYEKMWQMITDIRPNISPTSCTMDFEIAAHDAMRTAFPNINIYGCYFHFVQSIWRKVQDLGLRHHYIIDEDFRMSVKMLAAIAFVQAPNVSDAFESLSERAEDLELERFEDLLL